MRLTNVFFAFVILLCLTGTAACYANTGRLTQVEVIVFQRLSPQEQTQEQWPAGLLRPVVNNTDVVPFLPYSRFRLNSEERALQRDSDYRILLHTAWIQSADGTNPTKAVRISGGNLYDSHGGLLNTENAVAPADSYWQIDGTFKISTSHFFDVYTNLLLTEPYSSANLQSFRLQTARRMRAQELNYIDHPLFGVLIKIMNVP